MTSEHQSRPTRREGDGEPVRCGEPAEYGPRCAPKGHTTPEHSCCRFHGD